MGAFRIRKHKKLKLYFRRINEVFLKNMKFFILLLSITILLSTSCVYGCDEDNISVNNYQTLNMNALDSASMNEDKTFNALDGVSIADTKNSKEYQINNQTITDTINSNLTDEKGQSQKGTNNAGTFDDLDKEIQNLKPGDVLIFDRDYYVTNDSKYLDIPITITSNNITINGNGHVIDGKNISAIFNVAGNHVKIYNLTFINGDYHNNRYTCNLSPIFWAGDYGLISDCAFIGNKAMNGGAISWSGNYGLITNTIFENNYAYAVAGAIYLIGHDNTISHCIFTNSCSRICKEAIFSDRWNTCVNISDNTFDNETFTNDCLKNSNINKYFINGSQTDINLNFLTKSHMTWVGDKELDLISVLYSSIMGRYLYYNENLIFFREYNGTDFALNFIRDFGDGVLYTKTYHFYNITTWNDIFSKALNGNYDNNFTLIKNVIVHNQNEYENAIQTGQSSIYFLSSFNPLMPDLEKYIPYLIRNDLKSVSTDNIYKVLNINFAGKYTFNSKSTWSPLLSNFDMVKINGNGSSISVSTDDSDEYKWADLNNESSLFMVNNLKIEGFNMAVRNIGGRCIFNNVQLNNNKMDYWIEKDYGAGICNAGYCACYNCTFSNNYCKNGGAIFNQGVLEIFNCTFLNNEAYGKGENICNANEGIVRINGTQISGSQGIVTYVEGISAEKRSGIYTILTFSAMALGFGIGSLVGSPALGLVLGAAAGAAVGALGGYLVCTNIYDIGFDSVGTFTCIMLGCALAGGLGGAFGSFIASEYPISYGPEFAENELVLGPHGYPVHVPFA